MVKFDGQKMVVKGRYNNDVAEGTCVPGRSEEAPGSVWRVAVVSEVWNDCLLTLTSNGGWSSLGDTGVTSVACRRNEGHQRDTRAGGDWGDQCIREGCPDLDLFLDPMLYGDHHRQSVS